MIDLIFKESEVVPEGYAERRTVKAVVVDDKGKVLTFGPHLLGGGVEVGESDEQAIAREMLEEAGIEVEIIRPLGRVVGYRDAIRKKYIVDGFLCKYIRKLSTPTTTDEDEIGRESLWHNSTEKAIQYVAEEVKKVQQTDKASYEGDGYQSRLYNAQTALAFLKEAFKPAAK